MVGSKMLLRWVVCVLCVGIVYTARRGSSAVQRHGVKGSHNQQGSSEPEALESRTASEVEYVDGPLAPLYDFLIQRRLQTFCKLIRDAGLEQVIQDLGGSWTLFAPTDASFVFLPGGTLEELKSDPQQLRDFILYHFVIGDFPSSQIQNEMLVDSVQGAPLRFNIYGQTTTVSGAQILEPDLIFELGRVYIVDRPLHPVPSEDIVSYLQNYLQIYRLLVDVGLADYISSGTFTFLVPEDGAFNYLSGDLKDALAANTSLAESILLNHILPGSLYTGGITDGMQWETVGGNVITFTVKRGLIFANDIPIILPDISLTNGVIHVINRVLLPEGIENDCQCKPSSNANIKPRLPSGGSSQPNFGQTQRPQYGHGPTTRQPVQPIQRPSGNQIPGTAGQTRPGSQVPATASQPSNRPWNSPRTGQTVRQPARVTQPPYVPSALEPNIEDDINSVVGVEEQNSGHKRSDQTRTTARYPYSPTPQHHTQRPSLSRVSTQPTRAPQQGSYPGHEVNENYPEQDITPGVTQTTRQNNRWANRQSTSAPRYPTPQSGSYRTPATTRRPSTTRSYDWNQQRPSYPSAQHPVKGVGYDSTTSNPDVSQTQRAGVLTTSWQQRNQVAGTTRTPTQRPQRYPPPPTPSRRTPPRNIHVSSTLSPLGTPTQPFESSRQQPNCRLQGEQITPVNRNLPICSGPLSEGCQNLPYNPADSRPLCPESGSPDCRDASEPYNPSDNRPLCSSAQPDPECREFGKPTYNGDRRPVCSQTPAIQSGCKDPSAPYNPSDRRPVCRTTSAPSPISPVTQDISVPQGCRRPDETAGPQDRRPLCPQPPVPQTGCKDPSAPYNPADRRPVCRTTSAPSPILPGTQETSLPQGCRRPGEVAGPQDRRPLCPQTPTPQSGCKDPSAPYNPSDRRPVCRTTNAPSPIPSDTQDISLPQGCRRPDETAGPQDRRPLCSQPLVPQAGCKDPSAPYNPADRRPVCRTTSAPSLISPANQDSNAPQGCRSPKEAADPQDHRPVCPDEAQDCRPFLERPKPGDRRPVCSVNRQQPPTPKPIKDSDKSQKKPIKPHQQSTYPPRGQQPTQPTRRQDWQTTARPQQPQSTYPQRGQHTTQTTRRPSWQSTTRITQSWQASTRQPPGKQAYPGSSHTPSQTQTGPESQPESASYPSQPGDNSFPSQPNPGSKPAHPQSGFNPSQPPSGSQPQSGSYPSQPSRPSLPISGSYPSRPQPGSQPQSGSYPPRPQTGSHQTSHPQSGSHPSQPQSGSYPSRHQPGTHTSQPHSTQGQFQPSRTTPGFTQRRPGSHQTQSRFTTATARPLVHGVTQPGSGDVRPGQPLVPQGRPGQGHQSGSFTPSARPTTPRAPISVTGTTIAGEDTRRNLYEIVEDPALLIRGRPVKLTKIFSLFQKAGLEDILTGPGPTTVFLPSDDAFSLLPQGVVEQLEENPELLRKVLLYHITNSEILPSAQGESYSVPSLEGTQLVITMLNGGRLILISGAKAVAVARANNGIFYVINQLLYPLPHHDIVGAIQSRPDLSTLSQLLPLSGLQDLLQGGSPYTFLAPTDNAFAQLPPVVYDELTQNTTALQEILLNHIIEGAHYGREFFTGGTFPSARGGKLKFQVVSYGYQVNEVNIKTPEIVTGTGVIHLIDQVLLEEPDLRFFTNLENSLGGDDISITNIQDPGSQQPGIGQVGSGSPRPGSGQTGQVTNRPVSGQGHIGGLQPSVGQPAAAGRLPTHGQPTSGNQPGQQVPGQPQSSGHRQTNPSQPHISGNEGFRGRQPSVQPGRQSPTLPSHGQQTPGQAIGGQQQPGQQFSGQRSPGQQTHNQQIPGRQTHTQQTPGQRFPGQQTNNQRAPGHSTVANQRSPTNGQRGQVGSFPGQGQPAVANGGQTFSAGHQSPGSFQTGGQANDVAELARTMGLNQFANWVTNTGLLEKIHDGGVYTVFAPTDDAVSALPQDIVYSIQSDPQQVKPILQYHIVPQKLNINSVSNEETTSTLLQGKNIRFNVYQSSQPDCKQLVTASGTPVGDALATMGSIQVIPVTQVLYQPAGNVLKIVEASPILQKLSEAVKSARMTWVLSGSGPFTIFAPSDTAFDSLTEDQRRTLIEDKQAFSDLLKRHIVRGTFFSSGIQDDIEKKSENNKPVKMSLQEGILTVNSVPVTYADITATNGVLHVIDSFL